MRIKRAIAALVAIPLLFVVTALLVSGLLSPIDYSRFRDLSPVVVDRNGKLLHVFLSNDQSYRLITSVDDVDPAYIDALVHYEDQRFWVHPGVDPVALMRAALQYIGTGQVVSGGSTITMQVARLLEPKPRTIGSKLIEIVRALQLESRFSKRQILEMYLTMLPMGGNIEGVRAASLRYWGVEPSLLSLADIALLLAVPQSPEARRPDRHADVLRSAVENIAQRLVDDGLYPVSDLGGIQELPYRELKSIPDFAWHASREVHASAPSDPLYKRWESTIDLRLQQDAEALIDAFSTTTLPGESLALLIADADSGDVLAHVSGIGFEHAAGYLDLTTAWRSPGSTLKPFIYGMAFDDGLLEPQSVVNDVAINIDGFAPQNFDREFHGPVRVGEALRQSLNVPAVLALETLGVDVFMRAWNEAGLIFRAADAQLGLALGSGELTLRQLVSAYASLANGGYSIELRHTLNARPAHKRYLLTPDSARHLKSILVGTDPQQGAFKTGTSYGYRDSWAVGVKSNYVIGVWIGRPDGNSVSGNIGRERALPLAQRLAGLLPSRDQIDRWVALPVPNGQYADAPPSVIFPNDGSQIVLTEEPSPTRSLGLQLSGADEAMTIRLNGEVLHIDPDRRRIPVPHDGFYELSVSAGSQTTQTIHFAVFAG